MIFISLPLFLFPPSPGIEFENFIDSARALNEELREKHKCEIVIALTHMRLYNDVALARAKTGVDLILGGHDHVYHSSYEEETLILKSGADFKQFSVLDVTMPPQAGGRLSIALARVDVDSSIAENPEMRKIVDDTLREVCKPFYFIQ